MLIRRPISERVRLADLLRPARRRVAETVCEAFLLRHPDWITRHGDRARHYTIEDAVYHQDFLAAAIESGETSAFTDYLRWTAGVLEARGIAPEFVREHIEGIYAELHSLLATALAGELAEFFRTAQQPIASGEAADDNDVGMDFSRNSSSDLREDFARRNPLVFCIHDI